MMLWWTQNVDNDQEQTFDIRLKWFKLTSTSSVKPVDIFTCIYLEFIDFLIPVLKKENGARKLQSREC